MKSIILTAFLVLSFNLLAVETHSADCPALAEDNSRSVKVVKQDKKEGQKKEKVKANI
ncbi:MAG: hypothetical protein N4A33_10035 [Bacteriovoracaceae bacterium]|jgi:hypothetical protein|nr:hypothetical protein [Bacteriovoracaceae bacterium]